MSAEGGISRVRSIRASRAHLSLFLPLRTPVTQAKHYVNLKASSFLVLSAA